MAQTIQPTRRRIQNRPTYAAERNELAYAVASSNLRGGNNELNELKKTQHPTRSSGPTNAVDCKSGTSPASIRKTATVAGRSYADKKTKTGLTSTAKATLAKGRANDPNINQDCPGSFTANFPRAGRGERPPGKTKTNVVMPNAGKRHLRRLTDRDVPLRCARKISLWHASQSWWGCSVRRIGCTSRPQRRVLQVEHQNWHSNEPKNCGSRRKRTAGVVRPGLDGREGCPSAHGKGADADARL